MSGKGKTGSKRTDVLAIDNCSMRTQTDFTVSLAIRRDLGLTRKITHGGSDPRLRSAACDQLEQLMTSLK